MLKATTSVINASQIKTPITLPGDVTLSTGNLVIGTAGKGIDFSATPGTGTSELFNDYEIGTWTPVLTSFTLVGSQTPTGTYTKIGRLVFLTIDVQNTDTITSTPGVSRITSLPFTPTLGNVAGVTNANAGTIDALSHGGVTNISSGIYTPSFTVAAGSPLVINAWYNA
jgi:hypothetical protein